MTAFVLYAGNPKDWPVYQKTLTASLERVGVSATLSDRFDDPIEVDYIVYAPSSHVQDFTPFTNLKAVLSLWAGVESFQDNATLTVPLLRMVDTGLSEGMVEWVTGHVLRYHLGIDGHTLHQDGVWRNHIVPPLARNRSVGILGLGALGSACARALQDLGFQVAGWSRRPKTIDGIDCFSGETGLADILARTEILVLLLPLTKATTGLMNAETLAALPRGAFILNPGRGGLIDDAALLAALDNGHVAHTTLDVFTTEPLPPEHKYWAHPQVTVTPHIASDTRADTASDSVAENIRRGEAGEPYLNVVDRNEGY